MYEITITGHFSGAHALKGYKGKCEKLHGHNWKVEVTFYGEQLNNLGLLYDFRKAKELLWNVISKLDHTNLNENTYFKKSNPSSEEIARFIFLVLKKKLVDKSVKIKLVKVWENEANSASYYEEF